MTKFLTECEWKHEMINYMKKWISFSCSNVYIFFLKLEINYILLWCLPVLFHGAVVLRLCTLITISHSRPSYANKLTFFCLPRHGISLDGKKKLINCKLFICLYVTFHWSEKGTKINYSNYKFIYNKLQINYKFSQHLVCPDTLRWEIMSFFFIFIFINLKKPRPCPRYFSSNCTSLLYYDLSYWHLQIVRTVTLICKFGYKREISNN